MTTATSRPSDRRISPVFIGIVAVAAVTGWATWTGFAEQPGVAVFLFVSVIITVATDDSAPWKGVLAPVAIGGFIFTAAVTIGPSSGGSFNPARSIDPAIWAGEFGNLWIYIVGPLVGAAIAGGLSIALRHDKPLSVETKPG